MMYLCIVFHRLSETAAEDATSNRTHFSIPTKTKEIKNMEITQDNFKSVLAQDKPVVLDFWATWCGPCKRIAPMIQELSEQYQDQVVVGKVDVEENDDLALKYGIHSIPTVLFLKNGEVVDKIVGATVKSAYEDKIKALL